MAGGRIPRRSNLPPPASYSDHTLAILGRYDLLMDTIFIIDVVKNLTLQARGTAGD